MTGGVKLEFPAASLEIAVQIATERFRVILDDPVAELPWSTHFEFYEVSSTGEGTESDGTRTMCLVRIEFDRKAV